MSAQDNLNPKQFVSRGIFLGSDDPEELEKVRKDPLSYIKTHGAGIHWSSEPEVAHSFSLGDESMGDSYDEPVSKPYGVVLHGTVSSRHVLKEGTQEYQDYADTEGIFGSGHREREVTIREGRPVNIHSVVTNWGDEDGSYEGSDVKKVRKRAVT